ncbi:helix-hairpin-helix domain-containing protein [Psychroflexus montanilacus]|uniref:helix-hairpin-helix domain-containing protein n=1 Tax=Psychroflexus montanilacus TaxID=2873598 RepID=UPI001CCC8319|nr:helix-hairpin-helix domain-containing protein [Psychroflexus montanilacus]MBZ9652075.1 helix-hairpin-helix domain-containing protein [Psychroflexus montanilacus]
MNSNRKFRFGYTKGDRNGIFIFCLILIAGTGISYWSLNTIAVPERSSELIRAEDSIQRIIDSLKYKQSLDNQRVIYPFNPNFITDYKGYTLEMTIEEIDRLLEFRSKDQWINSKAQFQAVTQVSDEWMAKYSQYFKFPDWVMAAEARKSKSTNKTSLSYADKKDLNSVTESDLIEVSGIGETLAGRILNYREKLGGFVDIIQLKDVYGLKADVISNLEATIALKQPVEVEKQDINSISVLDLSELPYFDYELSRSIINFIKLRQGIKSFEELSKIEGFPNYKLDRIQLYLEIKE